MATFVLIHGAGSSAWYWHLVIPELERRGHQTVAMDLPCDDDTAGLDDYVNAVVTAIELGGAGGREDMVVVGQSLAGFVAPIVAERAGAALLVLVAAMVPAPGESAGEWWANTQWPGVEDINDTEYLFLHDVPPDVAAESDRHVRQQSAAFFGSTWPLTAWPDVPTRFLLCRDDRFFPADFQRRVVAERLGIVPDELDGGHLPALAQPEKLADRLDGYWRTHVR